MALIGARIYLVCLFRSGLWLASRDAKTGGRDRVAGLFGTAFGVFVWETRKRPATKQRAGNGALGGLRAARSLLGGGGRGPLES